jgi:general L-amino acid transport system permease protein
MARPAADPRLRHAALTAPPRPGWRLSWSDERTRNIVWQVVVLGIIAAVLYYLIGNATANLAARHIATGFGFLWRTAGIPIAEPPISYNPATDTFARALLIGILNTLKVAIAGIVLATILGTLIGIGRLSHNWLLARLTAIYVEVLRDIPLLLQLLFWYSLLQTLPGPRQAFALGDFYLSNRGIKLPMLAWQSAHSWALLAALVGVALSVAWGRHLRRRRDLTGRAPPLWPAALILIVAVPVVVWIALGAPLSFDVPVRKGFGFQGGGTVSPEFAALLIGLVLYTAAYIAEIVRAGIEAVPRGQWEAAGALGLRRGATLRMVVLPQSLRVIIPPLTSEYLNLTKNSSLAVAIGYQDIVSLANTTLNQTGQAIEGIAIIMGVYLAISLSISLFMNFYNSRIGLKER